MRVSEAELLKANAEMLEYKSKYFQARDEIRKANKGLARLARNNQNLRGKVMSLIKQLDTPAHQDAFTREIADVMRGAVPATNGKGLKTLGLIDAIREVNHGNGALHV